MTTALIAALSTALALWLWTAPDSATTRLTRLTTGGQKPRRIPLSRLISRPTPARRADSWRRASIELCQALSAELSAGRTPGEALTRAVAAVDLPSPETLRPVLAAARDGGDVSAALIAAAPPQGGEGLRQLAACWEVGVTVGAGLAALVERTAATLRTAQAHRQDVAAQLAGPRTTARLLAVLPALGLLMAAGLNMHPFDFLFGSLPGLMCLTAGIALDVCGLWWTNRMAAKAQA
ncbi:pilus assembly protein TadB [Nonomuraea phyllanthi]|uniref:Pilus assembly protein TadB n=1 Tax=Nonomuraea phyllanthi TaxID=2219224 RepID=A0A5C4VVT3_9ACTN|nr:type II secretion system F family protein [Nonomuraea phyllanthi]KAB8190362.1 pilus assembly protein TadB [Nonomuraea phyllanthi]QFY05621.1 pilus assembly protein TadB [Nonomuraea phyllanthi]